MEEIFKYLGRKAGRVVKKSKWIFSSLFSNDEDANKSEYQFGLTMAMDIQSEHAVSKSDLIDSISERLVEKLITKHKFNFFVIESNEVNGFALPGGFIFLTDALIKFCNHDENQIAFVLSHEIGHVVKGHSINRLITEYSIDTLTKFIRVSGAFQTAVKNTTTKYFQTKYSRDNEFEADTFAKKLMKATNFDTKGVSLFFEKLNENEDTSTISKYFSSHPPIEERILAIK